MILDNLGLSATSIKDKMKETGDMTKAVGEIIREQMSKAGDYVETAADRAAQANVKLQNKMEELGSKFLPLKQASDDLWTSIKVGILDIIGGPLSTLLNSLTRAGQLRNELNKIGSADRVNSDIAKLKGSNFKQEAYTAMLNKYSREEQMALDNYKKAQKGGMGSIAVWENRYLAQRSMREDFQSRGSAVLNGNTISATNPLPVEIKNPGGGGTGGGFDVSNIAFKAGEGFKADPDRYFQSVWSMMNDKGMRDMLGIPGKQSDLGKDISEKDYRKLLGLRKDEDDNTKEIADRIGSVVSGVGNIFSGIQNLGVEIPDGLAKTIGAIQTMTGILTSILALVTLIKGEQTVQTTTGIIDAIVPFARGGVVRAANGYVSGNTYSGDQIPAMLNAGEVVLNRSQVSTLAAQFSGSGDKALNLRGVLRGSNILLCLENTLQEQGKGELVTFKG